MVIFLDTTPLWTICHPNSGNEERPCTVAIAEINDYEARRELLRRNAKVQLARLDQLVEQSSYYPINTELMPHLTGDHFSKLLEFCAKGLNNTFFPI
jgi:hypothetical protein